jgi:hypothetical protein
VGPGLVSSVAYIDPGNWATDLEAGASYGYKLLFIVLLAGLAAVGECPHPIHAGFLISLSSPSTTFRTLRSSHIYIATPSNASIILKTRSKVPQI